MLLRAIRVLPSAARPQPPRLRHFQPPVPQTPSPCWTFRPLPHHRFSSHRKTPSISTSSPRAATHISASLCKPNFEPRRSDLGGWTLVFALLVGVATLSEILSDERSPDLVYPPLDDSKDSIRVLTVLPGGGNSSVKCTLTSTTFSEDPEYEALSYAWGDSGKSKKIQVNGRWVEVKENLFLALKRLRYTNAPRNLWIDSLCLDQKDTNEKNKQIPLMAFIYRRARKVIIWLGEHEPPIGVQSRLQQSQDWHDESTRANKSKTWLKIEPFIWQLAHEEYWKRTWIIQEVIMASNIFVHYGYHQLPWSDFMTWVNRYEHLNPRDDAIVSINRLEVMRQFRFTNAEQFSLKHLVHMFGESFSSIAHDKIYAFLPMAYDHLESGIPVDYNKSLADVYRDVVRYFGFVSDVGEKVQSIEMVYYSALTRHLLARKAARRWKSGRPVFEDIEDHTIPPGPLTTSTQPQPVIDSSTSERPTERRDQNTGHGYSYPSFGLSYNPVWVSEAPRYSRQGSTQTSTATEEEEAAARRKDEEEKEKARKRQMVTVAIGSAIVLAMLGTVYYMFSRKGPSYPQEWYWQDSGPEDLSMWTSQKEEDIQRDEHVILRGAIVGRVNHIGPIVHSLTASHNRTKLWTADLSSHFPQGSELNKARGRNEKLLVLLNNTADFRTRNVVSLQREHNSKAHPYIPSPPRVFTGSNTMVGLLPPNAKKGDIIVQFWNSAACAVLRENPSEEVEFRQFGAPRYELIGRAAIVGDGENADWDVPKDKGRFESVRDGLSITVTLDQLTKLSLDTVNLSGSRTIQPLAKSRL